MAQLIVQSRKIFNWYDTRYYAGTLAISFSLYVPDELKLKENKRSVKIKIATFMKN